MCGVASATTRADGTPSSSLMLSDWADLNGTKAAATLLLLAPALLVGPATVRALRHALAFVLAELRVLFLQLGLLLLRDGSLFSWPFVQWELRQLLTLERNRLLYVHDAKVQQWAANASGWQQPPTAIMAAPTLSLGRRLVAAKDALLHGTVSDDAVKALTSHKSMGAKELVLKDLVLVGGGHAHAHVLKMFGMKPEPGVRLTLITRDVDTPYSGMLPGYVAGMYSWREAHIDLVKLGGFAKATLVHAEACGLDTANRRVLLKGRPPIQYDVVSIDIGSAPRPLPHTAKAPRPRSPARAKSPARSGAGVDAAAGGEGCVSVTPVKPIDGFCRRWDTIVARVLGSRPGSRTRLVVVGAGAGGVRRRPLAKAVCLGEGCSGRRAPGVIVGRSRGDRGEIEGRSRGDRGEIEAGSGWRAPPPLA